MAATRSGTVKCSRFEWPMVGYVQDRHCTFATKIQRNRQIRGKVYFSCSFVFEIVLADLEGELELQSPQ